MENNELRRGLIATVVEEWINKNLFSSRDTNMEKSLIDHINQYLKIENLLVTLEKSEPDEQNIILIRYGNAERKYELIFTLRVFITDDGCSESGVSGTTGYTRDMKCPQ